MEKETISVSQYDIIDDSIPDSFNSYEIVQVSDLHNRLFGENQCELVDKISEIGPDAVFITGDIVDKKLYDQDKALMLLRRIITFAPIYFVSGNHEWESNRYHLLSAQMHECGVKVLANQFEKVVRNNEHIYIIGVDDKQRYAEDGKDRGYKGFRTSFMKLMDEVPSDGYKILLCHRPEIFPLFCSRGIDLVFAGHAHGGQIRLPYIGGLFAPGQGIFPKYTAGVYERNGTKMVVSRGLGNTVIVPRIFNKPEIVVVTLRNCELF